MRFHWLSLAVVVGLGAAMPPGFAMSNADYLAGKAKKTVTPLETTDQFVGMIMPLAGQLVEFEGTVCGIFLGDETTNFLLQLEGTQTAFLMSRTPDEDIAIGNTLRVIARVPTQGMMLEAQVLTQVGPDLPSLRGASVVYDVEPDISIPELVNRQVPGIHNQAPTAVEYRDISTERERVIQIYADQICRINKNVNKDTARTIAFHLLEKSSQYGVDPRLTFALVTQESRFNHRAVSCAGAQGLGQLMPRTAAGLGVRNPFDIEQNLDGSVRYLAGQIKQFGLPLALAAYNAGPGSVRRYGGIPPYRETQNYVRVIWRNFCKYAGRDPNADVASR